MTLLSENYIKVEYLESSGTQYIDTGYKPTLTTEIQTKINVNSYECVLYGVNSPITKSVTLYVHTASEGSGNERFGNQTQLKNSEELIGLHTWVHNKDGISKDGVSWVTYSSQSDFTAEYNLYLFACNQGANPVGYYATEKIYYLKIYDNNTLVRDFIPVVRKSDYVAGMYDKVNDVFYTNAGTGSFTHGKYLEVVLNTRKIPLAYEQLSYIESTGTQYIDTGLKGGLDTFGVETRVSCNYSEDTYYILGNFNQAGQCGLMVNTSDTTKVCFIYYTGSYSKYNLGSVGSVLEVSNKNGKITSNGTLITTLPSNTSKLTNSSLMLWGTGTGLAFNSYGKCYYLKLYSDLTCTTLVRNFIPARRKHDSVVGMYDTVNEVFYTNAGTGTFTAGEVVPTVSEITLQHLPTGYTKLDYIQSSGTQYIDTDITDLDNLIWELDWQSTNATTQTAGTGSGSRSASNNRFQIVIDSVGIGNGYYEFAWNTDRHTHILDNKNVKCYIDGVEHTSATSSTSFTRATTSSYHVYIGKRNSYTSDNGVQAKFYSSRFWKDDTLIRNFIPAKRNSDNAIGMYDLVTKTFFENAGTGTFIAGDETSNPNDIQQLSLNNNIIWTKAPEIPSIYTQKSYIQSSGTQYIDTGVVFNSATDKVVAEFFSSETGNYKWSFGAYSSLNGIGVTSGSNWSDDLFYYTPYTVSSSLLKNTKHTFTADTNGCYVDTTKVANYSSFSIPNTIYLFGCNTGSESSANRSSSTIYSFKFYRNNVLLRDFVPAVRNSDSEVGMYDKIHDVFYTNAGEGSFVAG